MEMDEFLDTQGFWRKHLPRDASCVFRALSEKVFHTQVYHSDVRGEAVRFLREKRNLFETFVEGEYEEYLRNLSNPKVYAGHVEMSALSIIYRQEFFVFQEIGQPATNITKSNFPETIWLCFSQGNHYDLVYTKDQLNSLAFCQALVYGILYKDVFGLSTDVDYAIQKMLYDKAYSKKKKTLSLTYYRTLEDKRKLQIQELDETLSENEVQSCGIRELLEQGHPPFPYKVAKALDPDIYRNVEYDRWNQARKEQERAEQLVVPDFAPGVKCLVRLMENQIFHGHIQEMSPDHGPVTVYIEELGEKKVIPFDHLQPLAIPVYKALAMQGFNSKKSIRFLDGYLKNTSIVSLSTLVTDGIRTGRRYLKKKGKDSPFLLPVIEKSGICWPKASGTVTNIAPTGIPTKMQQRFLMERDMHETPSTSTEDKQVLDNKVESRSGLSNSQAKAICTAQTTCSYPFVPPQATPPPMLPQPIASGNRASVISQPPAGTPGGPFSFPFLPYALMGPIPNHVGPVTGPNAGDFGDFSFENLNSAGIPLDSLSNPFSYTFGTCELPIIPPLERHVAPVASSLASGSCISEAVTSSNVSTPFNQNTSLWTYNGYFTYLSAPAPGLLPEGFEWAIADETTQSFHTMTPGVPLFFFVAPHPAPLTPGAISPPNMFAPGSNTV